MIKNNNFKQFIVTMAMILLIILNNGMAQTSDEELNRLAYNDIIDMVVNALSDNKISIALCSVPVTPVYPNSAFKKENLPNNFRRIFSDLASTQMHILSILRSDCYIDSFFYLRSAIAVSRDGYGKFLPSFTGWSGSEWILFLESPFEITRDDRDSLMARYKVLNLQAFLNSKNFFCLYELNAGALCTYYPKDGKYPPRFIYSKGLVDDFKTIIRLQKNPSLLSASASSYDTYYNSMKDDLGKQVIFKLFSNPNKK
jgi:hypothetical protein